MKKRNVNLHVSDHAVLRWLEREHNLDIGLVRAHLQGCALTAAQYGAVAVSIGRTKLLLRENGIDKTGTPKVVIVTASGRSARHLG